MQGCKLLGKGVKQWDVGCFKKPGVSENMGFYFCHCLNVKQEIGTILCVYDIQTYTNP